MAEDAYAPVRFRFGPLEPDIRRHQPRVGVPVEHHGFTLLPAIDVGLARLENRADYEGSAGATG